MNTDEPSYLLEIDGKTGKTLWKRRAADGGAARVAGRLHDAGAGDGCGTAIEIVVSGGDIVTGHDPATRQGAVAAQRAEPRAPPVLPHRGVAGGGRAISCSRRTRVKPLLGAARRRPRRRDRRAHKLWSFDKGPDVPTPVTDGTLLYVVDDNGVVYVLDNKTGERPSTARSVSSPAPTARRRSSPTDSST